MGQDSERAIGFELGMINNLTRRCLNQCFAENGLEDLGGIQGPVIGAIYANSKKGDVFQKDIEKWFQIRRSTATVMLQSMEQKGLIERISVPGDKRLKKIVLTKKAEERHFKVKKQIDKFHRELEEGITPEEKKEFLRILDRIRANLEKQKG